MKFLLISLFILLSSMTLATPHNTLIKIKSVSDKKRSFITRQGRFDGIAEGTTLVFKANGVSFSAKATAVSRFYSQWELVNNQMTMPIKPGDYVTAYKGEEYMWAHTDGNIITQKHREALREKASWIGVDLSFIRGLSESISNVKDDIEVSRNGFGLQIDYYGEFNPKLYWSAGIRLENETIDIKAGSLTTSRFALLGGFYYMSSPISSFYDARFLTGLSLGLGISSTDSPTSSQSGSVLVLPSVSGDFMFEIDEKWSWSAGLAFESLSTKETIENQAQSTDQLNLRIMIGVHRFFDGLTKYH